MSHKLPNEIILSISNELSSESSLDLKPLTLVNRQWHTIVSPTLLSTISVTSLGNLLSLCDHLLYRENLTDEELPSFIVGSTKTIVIAGVMWDEFIDDSWIGLEDLDEYTYGEEEYDAAQPDVDTSFEEVSAKLRAALPLLTALNGLEWYGRFAGDYHLVRHLQRANVIRHLAYGIDMNVSSVSPAYRENAFLFEELKTLSITTEYEPEVEMFEYVLKMMHRNPNLEKILFDCKFAESMSGMWSLQDLIYHDSELFIWPNLQHLTLFYFKGEIWQHADDVDRLVRFLVAHPKLETLVLLETCTEDSQSETALPLSLSDHPDSLPRLKKLLGSSRLIAGVLESQAACSSLVTVIDDSEEGFDAEGAKAPYIDRILAALEKVPNNAIRRLSLEVPQLSHSIYAKFARLAPNVRFLEFFKTLEMTSTAPQKNSLSRLIDIPAGLNEFPLLDTINWDIAADFCRASDKEAEGALLELAKQVSLLKAVHCREGRLLTITRDSDGLPKLSKDLSYLDNHDYDWRTFEVDWRHRPMSRCRFGEVRKMEGFTVEGLINK